MALTKVYSSYAPGESYQVKLHNKGKLLTPINNNKRIRGHDTEEKDLICRVGDAITVFNHTDTHTYVVEELLGRGSFGQILKCRRRDTLQTFAVKVVNSNHKNLKYAIAEKRILQRVCLKFYLLLHIYFTSLFFINTWN